MLHRAVFLAVDDEADGEHVIDPVEIDLLFLHLFPDGERCLGAGFELVLDPGFREFGLERFDELRGDKLAVALGGFQAIGDRAVFLRFGVIEVDILHLALHVVQAELMGQGNVEHQGLELLPLARSLREQVEAAHDLETVRELEHHHPWVGGVADYEFFVILCFQTGVLGLDRSYLVEAVDHREDVAAERPQVYARLVASGLVKENGSDALRAQSDLIGGNLRDLLSVFDEWRAVAALHTFQCLGGNVVSSAYEGHVLRAVCREQRFDPVHSQCGRFGV